jgi:hypothetical protein
MLLFCADNEQIKCFSKANTEYTGKAEKKKQRKIAPDFSRDWYVGVCMFVQ